MADPSRSPDADDIGVAPDRGSTAGTPRWVKVFGIITVVVVLAFVITLLVSGPHRPGPGRHGDGGGNTPPASVSASSGPGDHNPSKWGHR